jgi:asparagine synthase (glutamine-hydrolysing)
MCGICGVRTFDGSPVEADVLRHMRDVMTHRGPDEEGLYLNDTVGFGHRRLSIIDLKTGRQPIHNEDETVWIVFNGEIYNHQEIRKRLESRGHRYYTQSDTETIVHAYEEYGTDCVKEFNGMFAFAIWDSRTETLFMARDRLGQKPLYYTFDDRRLVFASEIKSILRYPGIERRVDMEALSLYLTFLYVPAPWTMFQGIRKLPPASLLVCHNGEIRVEEYWDVSYHPVKRSLAGTQRELRERVVKAVGRRLISDVPLGAFLSGGVDSSLVVAVMSRLMGRPVDTYSVGFDENVGGSAKFNVDYYHAQLVSQHLGTNHHEVMVSTADNLPALFARLVWGMDEPLCNPIIIATYLVSRLAKQTVTVTLSGDGSDELFGGYTRYVSDKIVDWYRLIPVMLRRGLLDPLIRHGLPSGRLRSLSEKAVLPLNAERYLTWWMQFDEDDKHRLFTPEAWIGVDPLLPASVVETYLDRVGSDSFQDRLAYTDLKMWIAEESNMRVDKMSMLASLETRAPFLDHELVEFAATVPFSRKVKRMTSKYILKQTFADLLPQEVVRRPKWGFFSPASSWLRTGLKNLTVQLLSAPCLAEAGLFQVDYVEEMVQRHIRKEVYNLNKVWALLTFQLWYEIYITQNEQYLSMVKDVG